eukprot:1147317-Pelagomonas_calceolata.AAC.6
MGNKPHKPLTAASASGYSCALRKLTCGHKLHSQLCTSASIARASWLAAPDTQSLGDAWKCGSQ